MNAGLSARNANC